MAEIDTGRADCLVFHQPLGWIARIILGVGGALALSAPHELLIRPGVPLFQLAMIPFWIIGIGAGLIGAVFLLAAILGLTRTVTFDGEAREMIVDGNGSFGIGWKTRYRFADILELNVIEDPQTEGPSRFLLQAIVANASGPVEIDSFAARAPAEAAEAEINALMLGEERLP
ncbi:MAG TPA: hypothetical protein PKB01_07810 [Xanthobacteraceae bacterium]|nr:hypothetical protein [Xanthobacteraceae bacterium]